VALDYGDAEPSRLELLECFGGGRVELDGVVRSEVLAGRTPPALATMARLDATLARLQDALGSGQFVPLDRAALLRGGGYGQLFVELTARCNERCVHCYAESSPERDEALDAPAVRAVLDDARALGFTAVQFTGGDPLLSPVLLPSVAYAASLGFERIEVYTNGLALGETLLASLARYGVAYAFSFYSFDPDTHDAITRTPGSQRRTAAAIARVIAAGARARASVIVMDQNRDHAEATRAFLIGLGVPERAIGMDVQRSVGRGLMTIKHKDSGIALHGGAPSHRAAEPDAEGGARDVAFSGRVAVSYDGTVYPCIFSRGFRLGSVRERGLSEILREPSPLAFDAERFAAEYARREEQLSCWECRLRAALLATQPATQPEAAEASR
jgi:radical SAM protein with 4Fe4S-binding SPASM domain